MPEEPPPSGLSTHDQTDQPSQPSEASTGIPTNLIGIEGLKRKKSVRYSTKSIGNVGYSYNEDGRRVLSRRVNVCIPIDIYMTVKSECLISGLTLSDVVSGCLRKQLESMQSMQSNKK